MLSTHKNESILFHNLLIKKCYLFVIFVCFCFYVYIYLELYLINSKVYLIFRRISIWNFYTTCLYEIKNVQNDISGLIKMRKAFWHILHLKNIWFISFQLIDILTYALNRRYMTYDFFSLFIFCALFHKRFRKLKSDNECMTQENF